MPAEHTGQYILIIEKLIIHFVESSHFAECISSVWRQKVLTGYCFKYTDIPFCLRTDEILLLYYKENSCDNLCSVCAYLHYFNVRHIN